MASTAVIRAHCQKVNKYFFTTLETQANEAALMMANLLLFNKEADETSQVLIAESLTFLKNHMTQEQLRIIWRGIQEKINQHGNLADEEILTALRTLEHYLITTLEFYQHIAPTEIVAYGRSINHYRLALVALIRQHLLQHNLFDPFNEKFSYALLMEAGVEQNYLYFAEFLQRCPAFPLSHIVSLSENSEELAKLLLMDMLNSSCYFQLSRLILEQHAAIKGSISTQWKNILENYPLTEDKKEEVRPILQSCQSIQEFADVSLEARVVRNHQPLSIYVPNEYLNYALVSVAIPTTLISAPHFVVHTTSMLKLGLALCQGTGVLSAAFGACVSAAPIVVPVLTLGSVIWMAKKINFPTINTPVQPSSNTCSYTAPRN